MAQTPRGKWGQNHIATLLGVQETAWSKLLNGLIYPAKLQTMQKIEVVFGWPVSEQVQLIPMYWEWPAQAQGGTPSGEPTDLRYAIKLSRVVREWSDATPRTVGTKELKMHPDLKPVNRVEEPRYTKATEAEEKAETTVAQAVEDFQDATQKFVASKSPLAR